MIFTPMKVQGTRVYLPNAAGGFDLRNCPEPEALADFIATSCNGAAELRRLLDEVTHELQNTKACLHARNTALNGAHRLLDEVTSTGERVLAASEEMKRQLDEVTRERDIYKQMCALADALRNHERGMG